MIVRAVESQSTAGPTATGTSTVTAGSSDTVPTARQPPVGIETAAATNPTHIPISFRYAELSTAYYELYWVRFVMF